MCLAREGSTAGLLERGRRLRCEIVGDTPLELLLERDSVLEVVRTDLDELVARRPPREPARHLQVQCGAGGLGEARVGDVADEDVLEAVCLLPADRGALLTNEEVTLDEVLQLRLEGLRIRQRLDRARPERLPGNSGAT